MFVAWVGGIMKFSTKTSEEKFKWRVMLFAYIFANNIVVLLTGIDGKSIGLVQNGQSYLLKGKYNDFTQEWYIVIGS